jgi:hypothetical protein
MFHGSLKLTVNIQKVTEQAAIGKGSDKRKKAIIICSL